jgi:hypothetical protein
MNGQKEIEVIRGLELSVLRKNVRGSRDELERILADDFYEVGTSGRLFDKESIIENLTQESERTLVMQEFIATSLAKGVVLTTYRIIRKITDQEQATSRHCSVWKKRDDEWEMLYHQGTLEPKE